MTRKMRCNICAVRIATGVAFIAALLAVPSIGNAQQPVVATVGDFPVLSTEVEAQFNQLVGGQETQPDAEKLIRAGILDQLVKRQLVMAFLKRKDYLPNETQLQIRLDIIVEGLQQKGVTLAEHFAKQFQGQGMNEQKYRELTAWSIGWQAYLDRHISDENIASFFEKHRVDFDGTRIQVGHLLLKVRKDATPIRWQQVTDQLKAIRERVTSQEIDFATAVAGHSEAASTANGGDIGFIERHHPMPEAFSQVAFSLAAGEVSGPVQTAMGMHLIQCLKIESGEGTWQDSRDQVVVAMKSYLFDWLAEKERKKVLVQFADGVPHFLPGTNTLAP